MSDVSRKETQKLPAADNVALANEMRLAAEKQLAETREYVEKRTAEIEKESREFQARLSDQGTRIERKLDEGNRKLSALMEIVINEARVRERNDEKLGRSLDRIDEKLTLVARDGETIAKELMAVKELAKGALDGVEGVNRKLSGGEEAKGADSKQSAE